MRALSLTLALAAGLLAAAVAWLEHAASVPAGGGRAVQLTVARGERMRPALEALAREGVIARPWAAYAYARLHRLATLQSGTYALDASLTPRDILLRLHGGRVVQDAVTLVEGQNRWQIRDLLAASGWATPDAFDALCDDAAFLAAQAVPGPTCEGYLFPETYRFARGTAPAVLLATMFAAYRRVASEVHAAHGDGPLHLEPRRLATLASIVEKETAVPEERGRIACVFYNRLRAAPPWRLETDPTVIYAALRADPHFDGNLTRAHLRSLESPYNTYRVAGLPPGPIASFGRAALVAAAMPETCADYFFVANNRGSHIFCPTLACHVAAVQRWQIDYFRRRRVQAAAVARGADDPTPLDGAPGRVVSEEVAAPGAALPGSAETGGAPPSRTRR